MQRHECDVCIIGGGITAAMLAQKLAELRPGLAVTVIEGGKKVLAGNSNRFGADASTPQTLSVVDTARIGGGAEAAIGTIATGAFPRDLRLSPDGRTLIVANWGSGSLQLMDVARLPVERGR